MTEHGSGAFPELRPRLKQDIRRERRELRASRAAREGTRHGTADTAGERAAGVFARWFLDGGTRWRLGEGDTAAVYLSRPGEPPTGPLRSLLSRQGVRVLVPWLRPDRDLDWVLDPGPGAAVSMTPPGELLGREAVAQARVLVVPALAADTGGRRLGQGGGSYDRVLARLDGRRDKLVVVAFVDDDELVDGDRQPLPEEAHDRRVDAVLTPTRLAVARGGSDHL